MKHSLRIALSLAVTVGFALALAPDVAAQKLGKKYHEDPVNGYRFKYPHDWALVPVRSRLESFGLIGQLDGPIEQTKIGNLGVLGVKLEVRILLFPDRVSEATTGEEGGLRDRVETEKGRRDIKDVIPAYLGGLRDFEKDAPVVQETKKIKRGIEVDHRTWHAFTGDYDITLDAWTFPLDDRDICMLYLLPTQHEDDWARTFEKAAKTFEEIDRIAAPSIEPGASYEEQLAYHMEEASRTPGWRVVATPSEKFIIKTSSDNDRFIDEVIERLEKSRELYEQDFPPSNPIEAVSVVRICDDQAEFASYSGMGGGVAGLFNPSTVELVLYDAVDFDRNATYAVMSHEAFHQYCHFLFDQSEAHRWFDEGHGDYYGGVKFKAGRAKITPKMPAGLNRLDPIREYIREGSYTPIEEHLNANHSQWQGKGITSYSQSWSIIYMLRQGTEGNVHSSCWKDEYAFIIPDYVTTLHKGFREAYDEIRKGREEEAKAAGAELSEEDKQVNRFDLMPDVKEKIWKDAMAASWGQIDLVEFEENWLSYVTKHLK